jgi:ATP-binding cassette subfamily B multidrug efflux pump
MQFLKSLRAILDSFAGSGSTSRTFRHYLKKYWRLYAIGIGALVVVDSLEALPPLMLKSGIDALTEMKFGLELRNFLLKLVLLYMLVAFVQGAMRYLWRKYIVRTSMMASHDMRVELFDHLTSLAPGFFQKRRVGDLVSLSTNDIEAVRFALGPGALTIFDACFYFLIIPPIMLWISPKLTVIAFIPLLVVPFFVRKMEAKIQARFRVVQDRFSVLAASCQEALAGVRVVKGSALEVFKEREVEKLGQSYVQANVQAALTQATLNTGLESILSTATTLLFLLGGSFVIGDQISLGVFVAFQRYVQKLQWPMEAFGLAANIFQRSVASQARIDEATSEKPQETVSDSVAVAVSDSVPDVEIRGLSFKYPGAASPALRDVTLKIPAGTRVGIAGGIGSGKSTLLQCLARTLTPPAGCVFFDGKDAASIPLRETRRRIAFVPQESFLFSRTVEDNILYGSSHFDLEDRRLRREHARDAARLAAVDDDALRLPHGYTTMLGERGTNVSGGQRQRLTIARAIARKPQLLLLDDCMSAIDAETEARLIEGVLRASEGISLVIASHRVSSFRRLDWLVLLENGAVAAQGRPEELMRSHPKLAELDRREKLEEMDLLR